TRRSIRPFHDGDEAEVVGVWHRSGLAAYTYLPTWQALTMERAQCVFHHIIRAQCAIWVGTLNEHIVAYRVLPASQLDMPDVIRGTRLPSRTCICLSAVARLTA